MASSAKHARVPVQHVVGAVVLMSSSWVQLCVVSVFLLGLSFDQQSLEPHDHIRAVALVSRDSLLSDHSASILTFDILDLCALQGNGQVIDAWNVVVVVRQTGQASRLCVGGEPALGSPKVSPRCRGRST